MIVGLCLGWIFVSISFSFTASLTRPWAADRLDTSSLARSSMQHWAYYRRYLGFNPVREVRRPELIPLYAQSVDATSTQVLVANKKAKTYDLELRKCISSGKFVEAKTLLSNATEKSFEKSVVYIVCETCRRSGHLSHVVALLQSISFPFRCLEDDIMPLLKQCIDEKKIHFLQHLVDYLVKQRGLAMTAKAYSLLLKGYGVARWETSVDSLLAHMAEGDLEVDLVLLNSAMDAYIRCGNVCKAAQLFQTTRPDVLVQKLLSKIYPSKASKPMAKAILDYFERKATYIKPDVRTFNILLRVWQGAVSPQDIENSVALLDIMSAANMKPNSITISTLITSCLRANDMQRAMKLLQDNPALAGVEAFTSIIAKAAQDGDLELAISTLQVMIQQGIQPNFITWSCIMTACVGTKDLVRAKELLAIADGGSSQSLFNSNSSVVLSNQDKSALYNAYVVACFKLFSSDANRSYFLLEGLYALMLLNRKRIALETATYNAFMMCLTELSCAKEAVWLLKIMTAESGRGLVFDDYTYSALFTALGKLGYVDEAVSTFNMLRQEAVVNTYILNSLLSACVRRNCISQAISIVQSVLDSSSTGSSVTNLLDKASFCIVLSALQKVMNSGATDGKVEEENSVENRDVYVYSMHMRRAADRDVKVAQARQLINQFIAEVRDDKTALLSPSLQQLYELVFSNIFRPMRRSVEDTRSSVTANSSFVLKAGFKFDKEFLDLYRTFRLDLKIEVDTYVVAAVNTLFEAAQKAHSSDKFGSLSSNRQLDIRRETARLVFDDLVLAGVHPQEISSILPFCGLTKQELRDYNDDKYLARIRSNAASLRIFQKHGWNKMNSGWSPI